MTKAELIKRLQEEMNMSAAQAEKCINMLGDIMVAELLGGGEVPLPRIGKLAVKATAERAGRNPQTGAAITFPPAKRLCSRWAASLKTP